MTRRTLLALPFLTPIARAVSALKPKIPRLSPIEIAYSCAPPMYDPVGILEARVSRIIVNPSGLWIEREVTKAELLGLYPSDRRDG